MYLSRLIISNYRSIKFLDLNFSPTKNVIIGHNNAGKSNIIKALNIILGEQTPDYKKYENISERDFFNGKENELFIIGEISKKESSKLNFEILKNTSSGSSITLKNSLKDYYENDSFDDFIEEAFGIDFEGNSLSWASGIDDIEEGTKRYIKFKNISDSELDKLKTFLESIDRFIYIFRVKRNENDEIDKNFRLVLVKGDDWYLCNRAFVRNEILISAIIPPFRDPEYQLKPTNWNWYGKMIKNLIKEKKEDFQGTENPFNKLENARKIIKENADKIFEELKNEIENTSLISGFDGAKLIFSFMDDEIDISKNIKIYIDDGFTAPINEKGAGIQSAIVISLFTYFVRKNAVSNSLLCLEEPEIYLHPHACRVINKKINHFINDNENNIEHQVILTTHNPVFVKDENIHNPRIFRVWKDKENGTQARYVEINEEFKNLFIREENTELFFARKVIITEGFDKYILKFYDSLENSSQLDEKNISIVSAEGKNDFINFIKICEKLGIDSFILADFDYLLRGDLLKNEMKDYMKKHLEENEFRQLIKKLEIIINQNFPEKLKVEYNITDSVLEKLKEFKDNAKQLSHLDMKKLPEEFIKNFKNLILSVIEDLKKTNFFILTGEIENSIRDEYRNDILKETNEGKKFTFESVVKLRKYLIEDNKNFSDIFEEEFLNVLNELIKKV
ncbi:MAG TPA: DUF2813 domain-containing protein [Persephonella sp.]|nr:DUF2813 domain-containing protein [Persephonella sp.]